MLAGGERPMDDSRADTIDSFGALAEEIVV